MTVLSCKKQKVLLQKVKARGAFYDSCRMLRKKLTDSPQWMQTNCSLSMAEVEILVVE